MQIIKFGKRYFCYIDAKCYTIGETKYNRIMKIIKSGNNLSGLMKR